MAAAATLLLTAYLNHRRINRLPLINSERHWEAELKLALDAGRANTIVILPRGDTDASSRDLINCLAKLTKDPKFACLKFGQIPSTVTTRAAESARASSYLGEMGGVVLSGVSSFVGSMIDPRASVRYRTVSSAANNHSNKPVVIVVYEDQVVGTLVAPESKEQVYSYLLRHSRAVQSSPRSMYTNTHTQGAKPKAPRQYRRGG